MGRPPKLELIEKSSTWKKRIELLNKVRNYYKRHNLNSLNFQGEKLSKIDIQLKDIVQKIEIH
jgi:hypothetical protein